MARAVMLASHHTIMDLTVKQINNLDLLEQLHDSSVGVPNLGEI
jgi:hypothetical protein